MAKDLEKIDIRILKYKDYVKKNPGKAYGFYCLGRLYMTYGQLKLAEDCFNKALSLDAGYTLAVVGMIEVHICTNRFLKAVSLYNTHYYSITGKKVYQVKLVRFVSSHYPDDSMLKPAGLFTRLLHKYELHAVSSQFKKQPGNLIINLILCMYNLSRGDMGERTVVIFNTCVLLDGLDDNMRWELVNILSRDNAAIYQNTEIAGKFSAIPDAAGASKYVNTLFEASLAAGRAENTGKFFLSLKELDKALSLPNLWRFLYWCRENSVYNSASMKCCRRLIKSGWIDSLTAETVQKLKEINAAGNTEYEDRVLKLFGYDK